MKNLLSNKLFIIAMSLIVIGGAGYFIYSSMANKSDKPAADTSTSDVLKQLKDAGGEEDSDISLDVDVNSLRKDLPLYPNVSHEPLPMMGEGYYRWNVTTPKSDISAVGNEIKTLAISKNWEVYSEHETDAGYELGFSKDGDKLIVNARNDGAEGKTVAYYEFMTEKFIKDNDL